MPIVESGIPIERDNIVERIPVGDDEELIHGDVYELRWSGKIRIPEADTTGTPSGDPGAIISGELYREILAQGHEYPHYFYFDYKLISSVYNGGYFDYLIHACRVQFVAGHPITGLEVIAILAVLTALGIITYIGIQALDRLKIIREKIPPIIPPPPPRGWYLGYYINYLLERLRKVIRRT